MYRYCYISVVLLFIGITTSGLLNCKSQNLICLVEFSKNLFQLSDQVLTFTINLPVYIMEIIEELFYVLKEGQEIHYVASGNEHILITDKHLLKNVLFNLLSNASKYSAAGKQIHLKSHITDHLCMIQVEDQGIGIPAADQPHLFEQFFRAGNVAQVQGTGLGLAIVKRYVELIGEKINFKSEENQGTVFTITLPVDVLN
jgi:signal transduction histidine kinase